MRRKLDRFAENAQRDNILESGKPLYEQIKGKWRDLYFKNAQPIIVELGCGRGAYTIGLAELFPEKNLLGIDIQGERLWYGSNAALEKELKNVGFLRTHIERLDTFFAPREISEIWITFPDPFPRKRHLNRRLTGHKFLDLYKRILEKGGVVHLKTDNEALFEFTLEVLNARKDVELLICTKDLYTSEFLDLHHGLQTQYEGRYVKEGKKIHYLSFRFKDSRES